MAQNIYQFFIEPSLQETFLNRVNGQPLSNGYIKFFKDTARTEPKPVYQLTGTPSDPVFVPLVNPLPLTAIGATSDGFSNDIKVYYNPFDDQGNQELYYIEVWSEDNVLQFTRSGWPQPINTSTETTLNFVQNFYQDSQFLYHLDVPNDGLLVNNTTNLSYGGWVFLLPNGFTSINRVVFDKIPDYVINPTVSPRYVLRFSSVNPNPAELFKDLVWVNNNVNFLSNVTVTLQFEAVSNNGVPVNIDLFYQKVYGTLGSPADTTFIRSFTVSQIDWNKYTASFTVSNNLGKTIGPSNDDEIRFILRFPSDVSVDASFVNFILTQGQFDILQAPEISVYQSRLNALASSIEGPLYDNSNEGDVLTLGGTVSTSIGETGTPLSALVWRPAVEVGMIQMYFSPNIPLGYLTCNGQSYDLVGIASNNAYNRLYNVIGTYGGYGEDTFIPLKTIVSQMTMTATRTGTANAPDPHLSGFTIIVTTPGASGVYQVVQINTIAANLIPVGSYFEVFAPGGRSSIYWFEIDGFGTDPTNTFPASLVQKISLTSFMTADEVAQALVDNTITQVQVPDLRGMFIRGWDNGGGVDPDSSTRLNANYTAVVGDVVGSIEYDALQDHYHDPTPTYSALLVSGHGGAAFDSGSGNDRAPFTGGITPGQPIGNPARISSETRPINTYVNFIIKT